jgi:uncharacterized YigZ family protein
LAGDSYASLDDGPEVELRVTASRFLGQAFRADGEDESASRLEQIRRRFHDATHHCWAHRLGVPEAVVERGDDDGEPSGTAGAPILSILAGDSLFGVLVVVTRWFGGTKLGKGGLVRAYGAAARAAVEAAPARIVWREATLSIECAWEDVGLIETVLAREGSRIRSCERNFGDAPRFRVTMLESHAERLPAVVVEATSNRARVARGV